MHLRRELKVAFEAPGPRKRDEFIRNLEGPRATYWQFIIGQVGFIRRWTWLVSIIFMFVTVGLGTIYTIDKAVEVIRIASSLLPFITLVLITELMRSSACKMAELEKSCKYSLENIVMARLTIVGGFNLILFIIVLLSLSWQMQIEVLRLGCYLLVPSLLSCILTLIAINHVSYKEVAYICAGVCSGVSLLNIGAMMQWTVLFEVQYLVYWYGLLAILIVGFIYMGHKTLKRLEGLEWNLSLTA